jgi:hypothetical protein
VAAIVIARPGRQKPSYATGQLSCLQVFISRGYLFGVIKYISSKYGYHWYVFLSHLLIAFKVASLYAS